MTKLLQKQLPALLLLLLLLLLLSLVTPQLSLVIVVDWKLCPRCSSDVINTSQNSSYT